MASVTSIVASKPEPFAGSKEWCEKQLVLVINHALWGVAPLTRGEYTFAAVERNHSLMVTAVMALARLKGYVVEKKQTTSAKIDLAKLDTSTLQAVLTGHLDALDPASRRQVEAIAAGELELDAE